MRFVWPSRARPKAAKAFTPEFRLPLPSIEPPYISSNRTLPLFHPPQPPISRWQFFKSKSWGQHACGHWEGARLGRSTLSQECK